MQMIPMVFGPPLGILADRSDKIKMEKIALGLAMLCGVAIAVAGQMTSNQEIYDRTFFSEIDCL